MQIIRCPYDLTALFDQSNMNYKMCIETICRGMENLTQKITEFMVQNYFSYEKKKKNLNNFYNY